MVLLHAAQSVHGDANPIVATFDHASGPHTAVAVDLVGRVAMAAGFTVVVGRAKDISRPSEAAWRESRLTFLRAVAAEHGAAICSAHTSDDQAETILFREMRGAGPRGLAALAARTGVRRPLLGFTRRDVTDYARACGVEWVDDPTNLDLRFSRNRIRHEILPALRATRPTIGPELVGVGESAALWRSDLDTWIEIHIRHSANVENGHLQVSRDSLAGHSQDALGIIWPALLGRIGVVADWRGTRRVVAFTTRASTGQRIQLSGGWTVYRRRAVFEVSRERPRR
jgi:tRNA(Ile)-lysidine synthase